MASSSPSLVLCLIMFLAATATSNRTVLIQKLCSQTLELDSCTTCVLSDRSRGLDEFPDLIHSVLYCMYSQAVNGHDHADGLVNSSSPGPFRMALSTCSGVLFAASNTLWDAITMMEKEDYYGAFGDMKKARWSLVSCCNAFGKVADVAVPGTLLDDMTAMKRLFDVAHEFFRQIIKINPF